MGDELTAAGLQLPVHPDGEQRYPLWESAERAVVTGMPNSVRAVLVTRLHDAQPDQIAIFPRRRSGRCSPRSRRRRC